MAGRGFRDESCSRGLSNSHSGRCLLSLRHCIKKKVLSNNDNNNTPLPASLSSLHLTPTITVSEDQNKMSLTTHSLTSQWNQVYFLLPFMKDDY